MYASPQTKKVTAFQQKVYDACSLIPKGKVSTYGSLAKTIDCGAARAVGQALRVNPFAPEVPCHRVIKTDRTLGGFFGQREGAEIVRKRQMLEGEGVRFGEDGKILKECCWEFSLAKAE